MTLEKVNNILPEELKITLDEYDLFDKFLDELMHWNRKINLTAIRDKEICWEKTHH